LKASLLIPLVLLTACGRLGYEGAVPCDVQTPCPAQHSCDLSTGYCFSLVQDDGGVIPDPNGDANFVVAIDAGDYPDVIIDPGAPYRGGCWDLTNPEGCDHDLDGIDDTIDNCPTVSNPTQADLGETSGGGEADGVGDACDPRPTEGGDTLIFFSGFDEQTRDALWSSGDGNDSWGYGASRMQQSNVNEVDRVLYWTLAEYERILLVTEYDSGGLALNSNECEDFFGAGLVAGYHEGGTIGTGYSCMFGHDPATSADPVWETAISILDGDDGTPLQKSPAATRPDQGELRFLFDGVVGRLECSHGDPLNSTIVQLDSTHSKGYVGLRSHSYGYDFQYLAIYGLGGGL
jgi:hypothetical protein